MAKRAPFGNHDIIPTSCDAIIWFWVKETVLDVLYTHVCEIWGAYFQVFFIYLFIYFILFYFFFLGGGAIIGNFKVF